MVVTIKADRLGEIVNRFEIILSCKCCIAECFKFFSSGHQIQDFHTNADEIYLFGSF